ncbi:MULTISPECIES: acyl carrier protein [unclassified Photorhabdus]|uniref:acyl carrier protein n=1 Tax=unclassified Photorhabdus TaxID=2620880 RepID=UPI000DCC843B|nr:MULTISPECIES: acyl carrier protein [unclassified Photorhabdus]RAX01876.1 acyl carrier protein [Photorhabdus sp. S9-53]RAX02364.1 acyl carrier protein [Photorhabdus sp. S10-54]RAX05403.1 acyl carrier protein [Photorhabdus sp. S8-52]
MITKNYIELKLAKMLKEILEIESIPEIKVDNLIEQFNIDSIAALELLVRIEQEFHIQIPDEELSVNLIGSFHGLVVYIERKCNEN